MTRRTIRFLLIPLTVVTLVGGSASAAEAPDATAQVSEVSAAGEPQGNWAVGAGLFSGGSLQPGLAGISFGSGVGYYYYESYRGPDVGVLLERRLGEETWLLFRVAGNHRESSAGINPDTGEDARSDQTHAGATIGVRYHLWQTDRVTFSGLATLGGSALRRRERLGDERSRTTGVSIGAGLGAAVDYELMQQIYLQLSTPLMQVGWRADRARQTGAATSEATTWQAAAVISPSLELRFVF